MKTTRRSVEALAFALLPLIGSCGSDDGLSQDEIDDDTVSTAGAGGESNQPAAEGGGEGVSGPVIASVPSDTILSELTPEQATAVCEELQDATSELGDSDQSLLCTTEGLMTVASAVPSDGTTSPNSVQACQAVYDQCMAAGTLSDTGDCTDASASVVTCEATVEEVNDCMDGLLQYEEQLGQSLSCELADSTALLLLAATQIPASCLIVQQKCPDGLG